MLAKKIEQTRSFRDNLTTVISLLLFFIPLAFGPRTLMALLAPVALLSIFSRWTSNSWRPAFSSLVTPFLPFILIILVLVPFQEKASGALNLLTLIAVYVLARVLRATFSLTLIVWGIVMSALLVATVRQLGHLDLILLGIDFEKISEINGRNPAGAIVGFGLIAAYALVVLTFRSRGAVRTLTVLCFGLISLSLFFSASIAPTLAGLTAAAVITVMAWFSRGQDDLFGRSSGRFFGFSLASSLFMTLIILGMNFRDLTIAGLGFLERDFSTFTGRAQIWECYIDAVRNSSMAPWEDTLLCTEPNNPANLHNIFLESHSLGGWVLALSLLAGFLLALVLGIRQIRIGKSSEEIGGGLFYLGTTLVGLILGLAESYVFVFLFPTLALFLASPPKSGNGLGAVEGFTLRGLRLAGD